MVLKDANYEVPRETMEVEEFLVAFGAIIVKESRRCINCFKIIALVIMLLQRFIPEIRDTLIHKELLMQP